MKKAIGVILLYVIMIGLLAYAYINMDDFLASPDIKTICERAENETFTNNIWEHRDYLCHKNTLIKEITCYKDNDKICSIPI